MELGLAILACEFAMQEHICKIDDDYIALMVKIWM